MEQIKRQANFFGAAIRRIRRGPRARHRPSARKPHRGGVHLKTLIVAALLGALAFSCQHYIWEHAVEKEPDSVIVPIDMLSAEGEAATLQAELLSEHGMSGEPGQTLEFLLNDKVAGSMRTDAAGRAGIKFTPPAVGDYVFTVRLANDSKNVALEAKLTLCVRKKEQEFLVTDIDNTISDAGNATVFLTDAKNVKPMQDAPEVLRNLSRKYTIIYVTAREHMLRAKTKEWLEANGFPAGPVFFSGTVQDTIHPEKYKAEILARLKAEWPNMAAGAGDQPSDAKAYLANSMKAYIFRKPGKSEEDEKEDRAEFPAGTIFFTSWKELQKLLPPEQN